MNNRITVFAPSKDRTDKSIIGMAKSIKQIRIFISSPSDVSKERKDAIGVIEELNRTLCEPNDLSLFPLTWENNTYPSVGEYPQDVINSQIGEYDIFVGIMANRFGTKTQSADSGTEEEFNIAYDNRENTQIMFFFKKELIDPDTVDFEQLNKVKDFKKRISTFKGVYYKEFSKDFEKVLRESLTRYLNEKYINRNEDKKADAKDASQTTRLKIDFENYYQRMYEKYSIINTLVFHNSQRYLKDIYVAQSLVKENGLWGNDKAIKIDKCPVKLIKKYKKILITDTAGMGKSTILKRMFIDVIDNYIKDVGIPIYIELNQLSRNHTILQEIQEGLSSLSEKIDKDLLLGFIQTGGFIFFMDGYDEISIADRVEVAKDIQNFISKAGKNNYYILTSRPENSLSSFGTFQAFHIQPLTKDDAFQLLKKYDLSRKQELSRKLVELLQSGQYDTLDEYLVNPLLVSLLFTAYDYNRSIPFEKHRFYGVVFEAYFEKHDTSKPIKPRDKFSGLNYDGFDRILRYIGFECLLDIRVRFSEDTILNAIRNAKKFCGNLDFSESDFLKDLTSTVPLICKEGNDYKWVHKSLVEYFAARYIFCDAKQDQDKILTAIYNSEHIDKYINMLDIYYDIDYKGFSKNILLPLCNSFLKFRQEQMADSRIKNAIDRTSMYGYGMDPKLIEERIALLFLARCAILRDNRFSRFDLPEVDKVFQEQLGNGFGVFEGFYRSDMCFWFAIRYDRIFNLVALLFFKKHKLFVGSDIFYKQFGNDYCFEILNEFNEYYDQRGNVLEIDSKYAISTMDTYVDYYKLINEIIKKELMGIRLSSSHCETEVQRIKSELSHNIEDSSFFNRI